MIHGYFRNEIWQIKPRKSDFEILNPAEVHQKRTRKKSLQARGCFCFLKHRIMVLGNRKQKKNMEKMWENDEGSFARGNCLGRECG